MAEEEERELVRRSIRGDREAFGSLYRRSWAAVYSFVLNQIPDWDEARSVAQQAFLRAWRGIGGLREPERFGGWIRSVAQNEVRKWRDLADTRAASRRADPGEVPDPADPKAPDPAEAASDREVAAIVREELEKLPPLAGEVVYLRLLAGLEYSEIGERLGIGLHQARGLGIRGIARIGERVRGRLAAGESP